MIIFAIGFLHILIIDYVFRACCETRPVFLSLRKQSFTDAFFIKPATLGNAAGFLIFALLPIFCYETLNRPRCEMRPVCVSLPLQCKSIITKGCSGSRCEIRPGFLVPSRIWPFLGVFRAFRRLDGTSYRPGRKSVLNRKFAENNFFWPKT